ncbi:hypothetical protein ACFX19_026116 [Malus domestica]
MVTSPDSDGQHASTFPGRGVSSALCIWLHHPHVIASIPRSRSGCVSLVSEPRFGNLAYLVNILIILVSSVKIIPPRKQPHHSFEPSFPDIAQLWEAIANAIQFSLRPPQRTPLETVYNLKLNHFMGNKGSKRVEKWINHLEKTFSLMHR